MFVDIMVAGRELNALVNIGAFDVFMSEEITRRIKTVNSKSVPITGVVKGVDLYLGDMTGKAIIKVIPLDDYDFVVGLSFLDWVNASFFSFW
ncbi:hypothetical protein V6Z11_D13G060700 [Gossypium hirsutum]